MEEREILNCGDGFLPRRYGITGARERQREVSNKQNLLYCNMLTISQAEKDRQRLS